MDRIFDPTRREAIKRGFQITGAALILAACGDSRPAVPTETPTQTESVISKTIFVNGASVVLSMPEGRIADYERIILEATSNRYVLSLTPPDNIPAITIRTDGDPLLDPRSTSDRFGFTSRDILGEKQILMYLASGDKISQNLEYIKNLLPSEFKSTPDPILIETLRKLVCINEMQHAFGGQQRIPTINILNIYPISDPQLAPLNKTLRGSQAYISGFQIVIGDQDPNKQNGIILGTDLLDNAFGDAIELRSLISKFGPNSLEVALMKTTGAYEANIYQLLFSLVEDDYLNDTSAIKLSEASRKGDLIGALEVIELALNEKSTKENKTFDSTKIISQIMAIVYLNGMLKDPRNREAYDYTINSLRQYLIQTKFY